MGDFVRLIIDTIQFAWPFRTVERWERALYVVCGRWIWEVGPGVYPILWFFCRVIPVSMADAVLGTPRLDVTLTDGSVLSLQAMATVRVKDATKAITAVDEYATTTQELLAAVVSDKLAEVNAERLEPEKRRRLLADLRRWVSEETEPYGVEIVAVRFSSFVLRARVHRLLIDQASPAVW
jgi:regulator of protease activity HflC (stomatin/prohibitin superfamily)